MADQKPRYVPGTNIEEAISGNKYMYCEADVAFKVGDACVADNWGVMHKVPADVTDVGVCISPAYAFENVPKGQYGLFILKGCTAAPLHLTALEAHISRAQALRLK